MDSQPEPDIQITGYRIEARLGRGGMGDVYRAVQLSLGRRVALKILSPKLAADDVFRRRFLRESRIAASIDHPSIIPIYETGEEGGLLYIAMRYVDGMDLATLLRREGRLAPARTVAIIAQVASALDAAHARGLVHRDVKPGNILLASGPPGTDGHCYLCDFGLIKEVDTTQAQSALTATDQFVGTIPYVAPEQIEGRELDGRADVYALGCVVFHCLTGSVPFERLNDIEVVFAHMREPPPAMSDRVPGLPPALDEIVARAMAKSRDDRWPTCAALVAAMQAELAAAPTRDRPVPTDDETRSMVLPPPPPATTVAPRTQPIARRPTPPPPPAPVPTGSEGRSPSGAEGGSPPRPEGGSPPWFGVGAPAPSPGRAEPARPASGPPEGERRRPASGAPAAVHRGGADARGGFDPRGGEWRGGRDPRGTEVLRGGVDARGGGTGRRRGRGLLVAAAAIVLPVGAYFGAMQVLSDQEPQVVAAPPTTVAPTRTPTTDPPKCPSRFTRPEVGDPNRRAPLAAIRAHMGWSDEFLIDEIRTWRASGGLRRWYVKARQEGDQSRRGRWLVEQTGDDPPVVLASAPFSTRGYAAKDWKVADGQKAPTDVAGCLAKT